MSVTIAHGAPSADTANTNAWNGDLPAAAAAFVDSLGWPVTVDMQSRRLVLRTGGMLDALILPVDLADPVTAELATWMLCGPITATADGRWWTFFTQPCHRSNVELPPELRDGKVHAVPRGGQVILPPASTSGRWPRRPVPGGSLPPWAAVVSVARRALDIRRRMSALGSGETGWRGAA